MPDNENKDLNLLKQACESLGEHFDTVHIFVTRHESGELGGTVNANWGGPVTGSLVMVKCRRGSLKKTKKVGVNTAKTMNEEPSNFRAIPDAPKRAETEEREIAMEPVRNPSRLSSE